MIIHIHPGGGARRSQESQTWILGLLGPLDPWTLRPGSCGSWLLLALLGPSWLPCLLLACQGAGWSQEDS